MTLVRIKILLGLTIAAVLAASGCAARPQFATAFSSDPDPYVAGRDAALKAISALEDVPVKGLIFTVYYPKKRFEASRPTKYMPDMEAEQLVARGVAKSAGKIQNIGVRARPLVPGLKITEPCVSVLAMGGESLSCRAVAVPILDNRMKTGKLLGGMMSKVSRLKLIFMMSEMRLNFEPFAGIEHDDFIKGLEQAIPQNTVILGGNGMNNPDHFRGEGLESAQFFNGKTLEGYVVAMGIGGNVSVVQGRAHEFVPSEKPVEATEVADRWVVSLDGKPAEQTYRKIRGMPKSAELTSDWMHPFGIELQGGELYLQMILNWVGFHGKDKDAREPGLPAGSLRLPSKIKKGTKLRVLSGGNSAEAIVKSAERCVRDSIRAAKAVPSLLLVSDCCMRDMRLRAYRKSDQDEVRDGIIKAMDDSPLPMFGFYSFGGIGPLGGKYQGMNTRYQQNMFLSAIICVEGK